MTTIFSSTSSAPDRFRQDILFRLRWNVFAPLEDCQIEDLLDEDGTMRRALLSDSLTSASLAEPPTSHILISSTDVMDARTFCVVSEDYSYKPKILKNLDGSPITIKDFITAVHSHLNEHKQVIVHYKKFLSARAQKARLGKDAVSVEGPTPETNNEQEIFFRWASSSTFQHMVTSGISTFIAGEADTTEEAFWNRMRENAKASLDHRKAH